MDVMCESCFVSPTFDELKKNNIQLTDEQLMFIFQYTQRGVSALKNFRGKQSDTDSDKHGDELWEDASGSVIYNG